MVFMKLPAGMSPGLGSGAAAGLAAGAPGAAAGLAAGLAAGEAAGLATAGEAAGEAAGLGASVGLGAVVGEGCAGWQAISNRAAAISGYNARVRALIRLLLPTVKGAGPGSKVRSRVWVACVPVGAAEAHTIGDFLRPGN